MKTGCKGVIFLKINDALKDFISPHKLVEKMMQDVHDKHVKMGRNCERIIPITMATRTNWDELRKELDKIISENFMVEREIN